MPKIERVNPRKTFLAQIMLNDAKQYSLNRSLQVVSAAQRAGTFTKETDDITIFVKQRGKESKRKFLAIKPEFLNIPYSIIFRSPTGGRVDEAMNFAYEFARGLAPVKNGTYKDSITPYVNGYPTNIRTANRVLEDKPLQGDQAVQIVATVPYAATLEAHYYKSRGGLLYLAAKRTQEIYGSDTAVRFKYVPSSELFISYPRGKVYQVPVIEIGNKGAFPENFTRPGTNARRAASRARRAARNR